MKGARNVTGGTLSGKPVSGGSVYPYAGGWKAEVEIVRLSGNLSGDVDATVVTRLGNVTGPARIVETWCEANQPIRLTLESTGPFSAFWLKK